MHVARHTEVDTVADSLQQLVFSLVPRGARVLAFDGAGGDLAEALKARLDCSVTTIGRSPEAGALAGRRGAGIVADPATGSAPVSVAN